MVQIWLIGHIYFDPWHFWPAHQIRLNAHDIKSLLTHCYKEENSVLLTKVYGQAPDIWHNWFTILRGKSKIHSWPVCCHNRQFIFTSMTWYIYLCTWHNNFTFFRHSVSCSCPKKSPCPHPVTQSALVECSLPTILYRQLSNRFPCPHTCGILLSQIRCPRGQITIPPPTHTHTKYSLPNPLCQCPSNWFSSLHVECSCCTSFSRRPNDKFPYLNPIACSILFSLR